MKICARCRLNKEDDEFYRQAHGLSGWCRDCFKERSRHQALTGYFKEKRRRQGLKGRRVKVSDPIVIHATQLFWNARRRAFRNGMEFDLTPDWISEQIREFASVSFCVFEVRHPFQPSLDRKEPALGYVQSNVRVVWLIENYARNGFTDDQLVEFCKRKLGLFAE